MANPSVTLSPTSGPAGTVVTATVVRDVPLAAPIPVTVAVTSPGGTDTKSFNVLAAPETLAVACAPARALTPVSDDGTVRKQTFTVATGDTAVTVTATTPGGTGSATFTVVVPPPPPPPPPTLPGTPYASLAPKGTLPATLAAGPAAVSFLPGTFAFANWPPAPGVYGVDVTAQAQLVGSGVDQTIFQMTPNSSTAASRVPAQSTGSPVYLALMAGEAQSRLWQDFTVRGTAQGHIYDGIRFNKPSGPAVFRRVKVTGIPGNASGPPGETFSINLWHGVPGSMIDQCEIDGRDFATGAKIAASMCGLNSSDSTLIQDSYFHHNGVAFGIANWLGTGNQVYRRVRCEDTASTGFHHENCFGTITLDHCTALRNANGFHASANNSTNYGGSAVWNIIDPVFDGPKFKVQWYPGAYGNTQSQKIADIHLTVNGVDRPDLLYVGPP
jgi:hypothetical protein